MCPETEGERRSEKKRLVATFLLATTGFFIGYAPLVVFHTVVASRDVNRNDYHLYSVLKALFELSFNCSLCLNPIVYAFRSEHFQRGFRRLTCREPTASQDEVQPP